MNGTHNNSQLLITKEFLEQLIGKPVQSFKVETGSILGNNFSSILQSVEIITQDGPVHIVVKSNPIEPKRLEFVEKHHFFSKEFLIYDSWLPLLKQMLRDSGKDEKSEFLSLGSVFPLFIGGKVAAVQDFGYKSSSLKCENSEIFNKNFIAMIDMRKTLGFRMRDSSSLDYNHCRLVIPELAKLHALSWIYKKQNGLSKLTQKFPYMADFIHAHEDIVEDNISSQIKPVVNWALELVKKNFETQPKIMQQAEKFLKMDHFNLLKLFLNKNGIDEDGVDKLIGFEDLESNADPWLVGCHGDCWFNNLLFKYEESTMKPSKVVMLDLQLFQEACPTTDLSYFLLTSTSHSTRFMHQDSLLALYHEKFAEICKHKGTEPLSLFTFEELKRRYTRAKFYGLSLFLILFSLRISIPDPGSDFPNENVAFTEEDNCVWGEKLLGIIQEICEEN